MHISNYNYLQTVRTGLNRNFKANQSVNVCLFNEIKALP